MIDPQEEELKETFREIIDHIRSQGCKVKLHPDKRTIANGSNAFFNMEPKPHIEMAIKGRPTRKAIPLLIHEYCHFLQYLDKTHLDEYNEASNIQDQLLEGEEVTPEQREFARKYTQLCEYDCDMRTVEHLTKWGLDWVKPPEDHIRDANSYNRHIAWQIGCYDYPGSAVFMANHGDIANVLWPKTKRHKIMSFRKAISPIKPQEKDLIDQFYYQQTRKNPSYSPERSVFKFSDDDSFYEFREIIMGTPLKFMAFERRRWIMANNVPSHLKKIARKLGARVSIDQQYSMN